MKKTTWVFLYIKYSKFWSVSLEHFIEHKPLISEEWLGESGEFGQSQRWVRICMSLFLTNEGSVHKPPSFLYPHSHPHCVRFLWVFLGAPAPTPAPKKIYLKIIVIFFLLFQMYAAKRKECTLHIWLEKSSILSDLTIKK